MTGRETETKRFRRKQQALIQTSERDFIMPHTFMRQTHTHTQVYSAWRRRQTHKHVYLISFQNGSFHSRCLRTWESRKVFPNKDVSSVSKMAQTWDEAYLSKGRRIRLYLIHQAFKMYSFQINTPNHNKIKADG